MDIIKKLQKQYQPEQRTKEWFEMRNTKITASEIASCIPKTKEYCKAYIDEFNIKNLKYTSEFMNPYEDKNEYIVKKCKSFFGENVFQNNEFTQWGNKYENVATNLYSKIYNTKVFEFGLLQHPRYKWIGASPDGISDQGILLEIKCPLKRKISNIPPLYYWTQMQQQMEVCDIDFCDFMECEIEEIDKNQWENINISKIFQHVGILLMNGDSYIYAPPDIYEKEQYQEWYNQEIDKNLNIVPIYFFIKKFVIKRVKRNKEWFLLIKKELKSTFDVVQNFQQDKQSFENFLKNEKQEQEQKIECIL